MSEVCFYAKLVCIKAQDVCFHARVALTFNQKCAFRHVDFFDYWTQCFLFSQGINISKTNTPPQALVPRYINPQVRAFVALQTV